MQPLNTLMDKHKPLSDNTSVNSAQNHDTILYLMVDMATVAADQQKKGFNSKSNQDIKDGFMGLWNNNSKLSVKNMVQF